VNLITGANGSAAYYLAQELNGNYVGLSRPDCDLTDFKTLCERLDQYRPDVIYHLASDADVRGSFDRSIYVMRNNIMGTVNLFEACRELNIRPVMVICSTSEVYGNPGKYPITEDFPISPVNPYAVSKACQDLMGGMYEKAYGFRVVRTRAFGYINPKRDNLSLTSFAKQIIVAERTGAKVHHGNLFSIRTFCDVRDIAKAYVLAAEKTGVFNIGSEQPISIKACLDMLASYSKVPVTLFQDPARMRPTDVTNQIPDCSKFRKATGWQPEIKLEDSLKWLLSTCREQT
jgi:nucleoside-diphosphate-sugar epimerase